MNDETLEQHLRRLPSPELPAAWRTEILATARREARAAPRARQSWPPVLVLLGKLLTRNPVTASVLSVLWLLIFIFKAATPADPSEKMLLAHYDPNQPIYFVSIQDEIRLAQLLQDQSESKPPAQIP
jgi:hypothetical protein